MSILNIVRRHPMRRVSARRLGGGCWGLICLIWLGLVVGAGWGHPILQNPIWIEVSPERLKVKLYVSMRELNVVQGLPIAADGAVDLEEAEEAAPRHAAYVLEHLRFCGDGRELAGKVQRIDPPKHVGKGVEAPDRAHFIYWLEYPLAVPPAALTFSHRMVVEFPSAPGVPWDLSYAYRFAAGEAPPTQFGAISRGSEVSYATGFAAAAAPGAGAGAGAGVEGRRLGWWAAGLLGAALGLGVLSRAGLARMLGWLALAWLGGWVLSMGVALPGFLAAAAGGIGVLLVAADAIHGPEGEGRGRRWALAGMFGVAVGWAAGSGGLAGGSAAGALAALGGGCGAGALLGGGLWAGGGRRGRRQLLSLVVCLGGVAVLLAGLGIPPWAGWLGRLGS